MRIALLTCANLDDFVTDEHYIEKAIRNEGWGYDWVVWTDQAPDWSQYDVAIIRTTWDYAKDKENFLEYLSVIEASGCKLFNSFEVVKWNSDKKYLAELEKKSIPIIPTKWFIDCNLENLQQCFSEFSTDKIVVKPNVGAGSYKTFLISKNDLQAQEIAISELRGIEVMIQPYLTCVASEGEYSLHYFNKKWGHAILKKPKEGDFRSQEEFGSFIQRVDPSKELQDFADSVLAVVDEELLFARVDVIRNGESLALIELELIEPALYFRYHEPSVSLFIQALKQLT